MEDAGGSRAFDSLRPREMKKSELEILRADVNVKHEANEKRFNRIEVNLAHVSGQLKLAVALLIANGVLNFVQAVRK